METQLQERDLYQGYESTYDSQYIPNAENPHLSGGVFTINIPANEAKSLSFDHMALLGRFRVLAAADTSAVTNYHVLDPMLLCYLKSLTINGQQVIFQPQEHDGRLRVWLKYDIGKNARNSKYANYDKVTVTSTGPVDVLNKRGAQFRDVAQQLTFDQNGNKETDYYNFFVNLQDLIPSLVDQIGNIPLSSGKISMQFQVAQPRDCIGVLNDSAAATGITSTTKIELSDLSIYAKYYNIRPGLTAENKMLLEYPKPHDIFVQDVKTSNGSNFVQQVVLDHDFVKYVVCFIRPESLDLTANSPANYATIYRKDGSEANNLTANNNPGFYLQGMSQMPKFKYAYAQVGAKKFPFIQLTNQSSDTGADTYSQMYIALQQVLGFRDGMKIDRDMFETNCGFLILPLNNEALENEFIPIGQTLEIKMSMVAGEYPVQNYKIYTYVCCRQVLKGSTIHKMVKQ